MSSDLLKSLLKEYAHLDVTNRVQSGELMAMGGYADVYDGVLTSPEGKETKVAIKRFRVFLGPESSFSNAFAREIRLWAKLKHKNILPLLGFIDDKRLSLVSEWMYNGTIPEFMKKHADADPLKMAQGVAAGLLYLHEHGIVHSDLKGDNILVSPDKEPVLFDFGVSRVLVESKTVIGTNDLKGTGRWMAIELLDTSFRPEGKVHEFHTKETDVWAFGMVVYEIITGDIPYAHLMSDVTVMLAIIQGEFPKPPANKFSGNSRKQHLWELCTGCWNKNAKQRPTMKDIVDVLNRPMTCAVFKTVNTKQGEIHALVYSPNGKFFATGSWAGTISVWHSNGEPYFQLPKVHNHTVNDFAFTKDCSQMASASSDHTICVWDLVTRALCLGPLVIKQKTQLRLVAFAKNDSEIWAASPDRIFVVWDAKSGAHIRTIDQFPIDPEDIDPEDIEDHSYNLCSFALTSDEKVLLTGSESYEKKVAQWDVETGKRICPPYRGHNNVISCIALSPDGKHVATSSWDETIHIWEKDTRKLVHGPLKVHKSWVNSVAYSPSGRYIVSSSSDKSIMIWNALTGEVICGPLYAHTSWVSSAVFSPDGTRVASASNDGVVILWDIQDT